VFKLAAGLFTALFVAFFLFPYLWTVDTAIKPPDQVYAIPSVWLPASIYLGSFRFVFEKQFGVNLMNSAIVSTSTTVFVLVLGCLGAYALARIQFWGRAAVLAAVLSVSMFPEVSVVSALFMWLRQWGMLNTFQALIIPYASFALPFTLWALTNFFRQVPWELEEAALIDGCSTGQALRRVLLRAYDIATLAATVVFLARDLRHDRPVAFKVLHAELAASMGPERFQREIDVMAKLVHPGIVALFDSGEADGRLYYVMPLVSGETLRERLVRERRPLRRPGAAGGAAQSL